MPTPESRSDRDLLKAFASDGDERAFRVLTERYLKIIYGAALRRGGNRAIAEEASQNTLSLLARKASDLSRKAWRLAGWLHRAATLEAANLQRAESRHQRRKDAMRESQETATEGLSDPAWRDAVPQLDEALHELREPDRRVILMHYFQGMTFAEIGEVCGKSAAAVQRQAHRCKEQLARILKSRGVTISVAATGSLLAAEASKAVPATVVAKIHGGALATAGASSLSTLTVATLLMTAKQKTLLVGLGVAIVAAVPIASQHAKINELEADLAARPDPKVALPVAIPEVTKAAKSGRVITTTDPSFKRALRYRVDPAATLDGLEAEFRKTLTQPRNWLRKEALEQLLYEMGQLDGPYAVKLAGDAFTEPELRYNSLMAAYRGWGVNDPQAAWNYAKSLPPAEQLKQGYGAIVGGAVAGDLESAFAFIEKNFWSIKGNAYYSLAGAFQEIYQYRDPAAMKTWIEGMSGGGVTPDIVRFPASDLKDMATYQLLESWARANPAEALAWMEKNVDAQANRMAPYELLESWSQVSPGDALAWLQNLPADSQDKMFYQAIFKRWLQYDQVEAGNWLAQADPSPMLDGPFEKYVAAIYKHSPAEAMNWAAAITEPDYRARVMRNVAEVWREKDAKALQNFIDNDPEGAVLKEVAKAN